jgi:hypothetical protein
MKNKNLDFFKRGGYFIAEANGKLNIVKITKVYKKQYVLSFLTPGGCCFDGLSLDQSKLEKILISPRGMFNMERVLESAAEELEGGTVDEAQIGMFCLPDSTSFLPISGAEFKKIKKTLRNIRSEKNKGLKRF